MSKDEFNKNFLHPSAGENTAGEDPIPKVISIDELPALSERLRAKRSEGAAAPDIATPNLISDVILGNTVFSSYRVGDGVLFDEFTNSHLSTLYESLYALCSQLYQLPPRSEEPMDDPESDRVMTDLLNTVDEIMCICVRTGFDAGCRVSGGDPDEFSKLQLPD